MIIYNPPSGHMSLCIESENGHMSLCTESENDHIQTTQWDTCRYGPLTRYAKLRVAHAPGMPGTFSPSPRVSDPDMHHGTCVTHVLWCRPGSLISGFLWNRWRGKRSRCMRNPQFCVSGKRPMHWVWKWSYINHPADTCRYALSLKMIIYNPPSRHMSLCTECENDHIFTTQRTHVVMHWVWKWTHVVMHWVWKWSYANHQVGICRNTSKRRRDVVLT